MKFLDAFLNGRINDALFFASLVGIYTVATAGYKIVSNGVEKRGEKGGRVRMSTPRLLSPIGKGRGGGLGRGVEVVCGEGCVG